MGYTSDLSDKEWEIIEPLLPKRKKTKPPDWTKREILNGVFYQLKNGCAWVDLPKKTYLLIQPYFGTTNNGVLKEH